MSRPQPLHPSWLRDIPRIEPITAKVADITDAELFPETALALEHARKLRAFTTPAAVGRERD